MKPTFVRAALLARLLMPALNVTAQKTAADPTPFASSITAADLEKHLYIIAGKEMEGRGTGTPGLDKAAAYIEKQFRAIGLQPGNKGSYQYYYTLYQDSMLKASVTIDGTVYEAGRFFNGNLRQGVNHFVKGTKVVFAGYGIDDPAYSDYTGLDVKGKIVMVLEGEPKKNDTAYVVTGTSRRSNWGFNVTLKQQAAAKNGAVAILVLQNNFPRFVPGRKPTRGPMYPDYNSKTGPVVHVYNISDTLAAAIMGWDKVKEVKEKARNAQPAGTAAYKKNIQLQFTKKRFETRTSNVVGILPGTDLKDEYVVITAHMDHLGKRDTVIYYGADDDGSGTCGVIEIAEAFVKAKKAGNGPRRTIVFMTVSGEEKGLWGSGFYSEHPLFPMEKTTVNLNIDMIGRMSSEYTFNPKTPDKPGNPDSLNYVYVIGDDKLSSDLRPISEEANNNYIKLKLDYKYNDPKDPNRFYYRSDHYNFAKKGVPVIFYFNGTHADYHQPSDTPDKINYDLYARRAQLVFYTGWTMANRNDMLKRDMPLNLPPR